MEGTSFMRWIAGGVVAMMLAGCGVFGSPAGELAPPFSGMTGDGEQVSMLDITRTRKLLVVFIHPDGKTGLAALEAAKKIQDEVGSERLAVVGVVASPVNNFELWEAKHTPPVLVIPDPDRRTTLTYKASVSPTFQIIDVKGVLGPKIEGVEGDSLTQLATALSVSPESIWPADQPKTNDKPALDQ